MYAWCPDLPEKLRESIGKIVIFDDGSVVIEWNRKMAFSIDAEGWGELFMSTIVSERVFVKASRLPEEGEGE